MILPQPSEACEKEYWMVLEEEGGLKSRIQSYDDEMVTKGVHFHKFFVSTLENGECGYTRVLTPHR